MPQCGAHAAQFSRCPKYIYISRQHTSVFRKECSQNGATEECCHSGPVGSGRVKPGLDFGTVAQESLALDLWECGARQSHASALGRSVP